MNWTTGEYAVGRGKERMAKRMNDEMTSPCRLCPRDCKALRKEGQRGFCGQSNRLVAARAALHFWEEPCISGISGSGAVFFSGCALRCVFCQNAPIARGQAGKEISQERMAEIFLELQEKGANNINLVTAGHFVPWVIRALELAKRQGLELPIVYNSSSYEKVETLRQLEGLVDIYLPDFKYVSRQLSVRYSQAGDYFSVASLALAEMVRQTGEALFYRKEAFAGEVLRPHPDQPGRMSAETTREKGCRRRQGRWLSAAEYNQSCDQSGEILMQRGTLVRHLLLPGAVWDSMKVLDYLYQTYRDQIFISIMNQYTPMPGLDQTPELDRKVTNAEYEAVIDHALALGIENAFIQEGDVAEESFIPDFGRGEGL